MDPKQRAVAEVFDRYRECYSDAVNSALDIPGFNVDYFTRVKSDYIRDIVATGFECPNKLRALDVGCGVGNYHSLLRGNFAELVGVDVSPECVDAASKRNDGGRYDTYDGEHLPYEDNAFDVAFTICVLHHVPPGQWPGFTAEIHRIIRPGGLAIIFEHNPYNPITRRIVNRCPFDKDAVLLRASTTRGLLEDAGFSDVRSRSILTVPAGTKFLRRVDGWLSGLPLGAQYVATGRKLTSNPRDRGTE
jgi:SAM-dependent methyltransferase